MELFFLNSYGMYMNTLHHVEKNFKDISNVREVNSMNDLKSVIEEFKNKKVYPGIKAIKVFTDTEFGLRNIQLFNILDIEDMIESLKNIYIDDNDCFTALINILDGTEKFMKEIKIRVLSRKEKTDIYEFLTDEEKDILRYLNALPEGFSDNFSDAAVWCFVNIDFAALKHLMFKQAIYINDAGNYEYIRLVEED